MLLPLCTCLVWAAVVFAEPIRFGKEQIVGYVDDPILSDASGLAASRVHSDVLYTHNDHGRGYGPSIYALSANNGTILGSFTVTGAENVDWEDIAVGPCPDNGSCIYISDTGYNPSRTHNTVYRVREPSTIEYTGKDTPLPLDGALKFRWSEHDAETLLVDPTAEVYVISYVQGGRGLIAHLPRSAWSNTNTAHITHVYSHTYVNLHTHHHDPVGGDISPDGTEVLLKGLTHMYYWYVHNKDYVTALATQPTEVYYHAERTGQAVCWSTDAQAYYTLGEGHYEPLYKYERVSQPPTAVGK